MSVHGDGRRAAARFVNCLRVSQPHTCPLRRSHIVSVMTQSKQETTGMRVMFWTWMILIVGGLAVMILLPLLGR